MFVTDTIHLGVPTEPVCSDKLGMENGDIADNQLSSTEPYVNGIDDCRKEHSRLNFNDATIRCDGFAPSTATDQGIF